MAFIRRLRDERVRTVLWIEHVLSAVMQAAKRIIVLDQGRILMTGAPQEGEIRRAHLGM